MSGLDEYLNALAGREATPGGGSAAALMGALGAALTSMVCRLTLGKKKYAHVEADMAALLEQAEAARAGLAAAMEEDAAAFAQVMAAYGLPKESAARGPAIQAALRVAAAAPMACARLCAEVIALSAVAAEKGNASVVSDAGVAALAGAAALRSSALNVLVNAASMEDRAAAQALVAEIAALEARGQAAAEGVYASVRARLV